MKKEHQQYVIIAVAIIAFVFIYFKLFLGPVNKGISEKRGEIKETENKLEEAKIEAKQLDVLKTKLAILELEVQKLAKRLPKQKDLPELLRTIMKDAKRYNIKISNTQIGQTVTSASPEYDEVPFGLQISGGFHQVLDFLTEIGQEKRLMSARNLQLSQQITTDKSTTVTGSFTLVAYISKSGK